MKCKACFALFDTEAELDAHIDEVHPKPPRPECPEGMEEVRDVMLEAMTQPSREVTTERDRVHQEKVRAILREWNTDYVHFILIALAKAGYQIVKP